MNTLWNDICSYQIFRQLMGIGLLTIFSCLAWGAQARRCSQVAGASSISRAEPGFILDPTTIYKKLEKSGILLKDIRVVLTMGDQAQVNVIYKGKQVGSGELEVVENELVPGKIYPIWMDVDDQAVGKGFGILLYLGLAKAAYQNGRILQSSYDLNASSTRIWENLVGSNLAREVQGEGYEFRLEVLQSRRFQQAVDQILEKLSLKADEEFLPIQIGGSLLAAFSGAGAGSGFQMRLVRVSFHPLGEW